jgi:hypothetical protein
MFKLQLYYIAERLSMEALYYIAERLSMEYFIRLLLHRGRQFYWWTKQEFPKTNPTEIRKLVTCEYI